MRRNVLHLIAISLLPEYNVNPFIPLFYSMFRLLFFAMMYIIYRNCNFIILISCLHLRLAIILIKISLDLTNRGIFNHYKHFYRI